MEEAYDDWYSDNRDQLIKEFIDLFIDEFNEYCKEEYKNE